MDGTIHKNIKRGSVVVIVQKHHQKTGEMTQGIGILVFAIWFTTFRFVNHLIRVMPPSFDAPIWFYPVLYILLITVAAVFLIKRLKKSHGSEKNKC